MPTNQFKLVLDVTWCNGKKKCVNGEWHWEDIKRAEDQSKETRKDRLKSYGDMTIYPARLVPCIMNSLPPPQTPYNYHHLVTFDTSFSLPWLKCMQLVHAHPTMFCIHLVHLWCTSTSINTFRLKVYTGFCTPDLQCVTLNETRPYFIITV